MANIIRGEVETNIAGKSYVLCLTLGAVAEIEAKLDCKSLNAMSQKFAQGEVSANDLVIILGAAFRGGGNAMRDDEVAALRFANGLRGAAELAAQVLKAGFMMDANEA